VRNILGRHFIGTFYNYLNIKQNFNFVEKKIGSAMEGRGDVFHERDIIIHGFWVESESNLIQTEKTESLFPWENNQNIQIDREPYAFPERNTATPPGRKSEQKVPKNRS
jgi:hypothetical protein